MKNNELQKGINDIQDIKLSSDEKMNLFAYLDTYSKEHPALVPEKQNMWLLFVQHRVTYSLAMLAICLFVGAGVTFAAESSLPGDVLYPVKIYVNEPVKAVTKVTPKAKAKYEEEKVIKRLGEVEELVKKGKFDDKKRTQVEREVEKSVNAINVIDIKKERNKNRERNSTSTDEFRKDLDTRLQNIKKVDVELKLDTPKENDNKDQVEKFEKKIKVQIGGFNDDEDKNDTNDNDKKENNRGRGRLFR